MWILFQKIIYGNGTLIVCSKKRSDFRAPRLVNDCTAETEEIVLPLHIAVESDIKNKKENRDQQAKIHVLAIHRKGSRVRKARPKLRYLCANMTVKDAVEDQGDSAIKEIIIEMTSTYINRKEFEAVFEKNMTDEQRKRVNTSKMFLKNKYFADGKYEKIKARLVAGGNLQDRSIYCNGGSPTAATTSVLTVAALAAEENRKSGTIDFPSAFLNCNMPVGSEEIFMGLEPFMIMTEIDENFYQYVDSKGCSIVRLRRALYGCVESARIWNDKLNIELSILKYERNPYDKCIYNRIEKDGSQSTLVVHVDDVLILAKDEKVVGYIMDEIEKKDSGK